MTRAFSLAESSALDAELALYRSVLDADYAREIADVRADADFERRKLVFTRTYGDYLLATKWNDGDPRYAFNYEMVRVTDTFPYYAGVSEDLLGANGSVLIYRIPTLFVASPIPAIDLNYWTSANALNADVAATARRSAVLSYEAAVAAASEAFVGAYGAVVSDAIDAELARDRGELVASVDAFATLETSILSAAETAEASWRDAIREAELGTSVEKYRKASVLAGLTFARDASAAFGTFQVGIREDRLASTSETDARYAAYLADVDWAEQTKSLRDQYCVKLRSSLHSLNASLAQYVRVYDKRFIAHDLDTTRVEFIADKKFILASQKAEGVYELARYDAQASNLRAYCAASLAESAANAATERALAATRADVYAQAFAEIVAEFNEFDGGRFQGDPTRIVLKDVDDAGAFDFDGLDALAERVARARGAATTADRALETENEATAADARAANKALFDAALREANETLASSLRASETDASLTIFGAAATRHRYLDARDAFTAERTPRELNDYATIVRNKMKTIGTTLDGYAKIFAYNQERIDLYGGTVSGNVFADSTFDYEICFVAGTPVVMADGRVRPIETLRPGDEVLAADHLLPEGKPRAARVVRFFDNGEKPVVRLRFDGFELVCTPEHPFYIVGKGWTRASALAVGDFALNASGGRVAFLGREAVDGTRRVYNIEVEGAHTYFVGDGGGVLAHNACGYRDAFFNAFGSFADKLRAFSDKIGGQVHHTLPQRLRDGYLALGVNVDDVKYLKLVPASIHRQITAFQNNNIAVLMKEKLKYVNEVLKIKEPEKAELKAQQLVIADERYIKMNRIIEKKYSKYWLGTGFWDRHTVKWKIRKIENFVKSGKSGLLYKKVHDLMTSNDLQGIKNLNLYMELFGNLLTLYSLYESTPERELAFAELKDVYSAALRELQTNEFLSSNLLGHLSEKTGKYMQILELDPLIIKQTVELIMLCETRGF